MNKDHTVFYFFKKKTLYVGYFRIRHKSETYNVISLIYIDLRLSSFNNSCICVDSLYRHRKKNYVVENIIRKNIT